MSFWEFIYLADANVRQVVIGCALLGAISSFIGAFMYFQRRALVGDAVAHGVLPGICLAFLVTGNKDMAALIIGALCSGWLAVRAISWITRRTTLKQDAALAIVLSTFFGFGIYLLTYIQQLGMPDQSGLNNFLFGKAAAIVRRDVWWLLGFAGVVLVVGGGLFRGFLVISFNKSYGKSLGLPVAWIEQVLLLLSMLNIILGIQAVGIVLMVALLVTPAAAARFWTTRLWPFFGLSVGFGVVASVSGAYISYLDAAMPTGPWVVVSLSIIALGSFLFAPQGWVYQQWAQVKERRKMIIEHTLKGLYGKADVPQPACTLGDMCSTWAKGQKKSALLRILNRLKQHKKIAHAHGKWHLLPIGIAQAKQIIARHRLWETYLAQQVGVDSNQVHAEAERIEHMLDETLDRKLRHLMGNPTRDPHNRKIFDVNE